MKKFLAIITLLIGGIALLGGCAANNEDFTPQSYSIEATEIVELQIEVQNRKIEILPATDNKIHLDYAQSSKEFYDITLTDGVLLRNGPILSAPARIWPTGPSGCKFQTGY